MPGFQRPIEGGRTALIVMPGTGSDADYLHRSFGPAADRMGFDLVALEPADNLVQAHRSAIDEHVARYERFIVGGVSIGAAIGLQWALESGHPGCIGVWAALPAWSGPPDDAPASWSARITADALEKGGIDATIAAMSASSPRWLADELSRSWRVLFPGLITQLRDAAAYHAPTPEEITRLRVPLAVTAAVDDPIHPLDVAHDWYAAAARAQCREVSLENWGPRPALLGDSCAQAWMSLQGGDQWRRS